MRRMLLRGMLVSLALTAAMGVLAVLAKSGNVIEQILWTAGTAALAFALLIPLTSLLERERLRAAALAAISTVTLAFAIAVLLIWEVDELVGVNAEEELVVTMGIVLLGGVATGVFLWLGENPMHRAARLAGLATTAATCVLWLADVWLDFSYGVSNDLVETGAAVGILGLLLVVVLVGAGDRPRGAPRILAMSATLIALYMWVTSIWGNRGGPLATVVYAVFIAFAALIGHANLVGLASLRPRDEWMRRATRYAARLAAVLVVAVVVSAQFQVRSGRQDLLTRSAGAAGILTACASLALGVQARLTRRAVAIDTSTPFAAVELTCPRCSRKQSLATGGGACAGCGLRIEIQLIEPRCPECEYRLYGTDLARCPECGSALSAVAGGQRSPALP